MDEYKIYNELTEIKGQYRTGSIEIFPGLLHSQYKVLRMCEFYSNSRFTDTRGNKDALGRDKPFYNIVNFRVTLSKVATDMDIKDVQITSDDPKHYVESMFLNKEAYEWMKKTNFADTLNRIGYKRPKYGGVLVKKCYDEDGELQIDVMDWRNIYTDQISILDNPIIECHYMTPVDLKKKAGIWKNVDAALEEFKKKPKGPGVNSAGSVEGEKNDAYSTRIEVYEMHGQFQKGYLAEVMENGMDQEYALADNEEYEYSQQVYYIGDVNGKRFYFYADEEKESPYDYLPWETMEGRALGRGVIEDAEEAQVWTNDAVINEKNAMDLAGRVGVKTTSKTLGNNVLEHDFGKVYELKPGEELDTFQLNPSALGEYQNQMNKWRDQVDRATSSYDANTGEQPPSGTPYSQTALLNQVASRPFDYRREEQGIFITRIFEKWVIPYLVKKLYKKHILVTDFTQEELDFIDNRFAEKQVRQMTVDALMEGNIISPDQQATLKEDIKGQLNTNKTKRYIEFPEGFFDDVLAKVTVVTTNEQRNKAAVMESLNSFLTTISQSYNPQTGSFTILENPITARIVSTIMEISGSGISPVGLGLGKPQQQPMTPVPAMAGANAGGPVNTPTPNPAANAPAY